VNLTFDLLILKQFRSSTLPPTLKFIWLSCQMWRPISGWFNHWWACDLDLWL